MSSADIAKLLNLGDLDSNALSEVISDYFGGVEQQADSGMLWHPSKNSFLQLHITFTSRKMHTSTLYTMPLLSWYATQISLFL